MGSQYEVDVLIVGGGASGLAASMLLSSQGVRAYCVSKYPSTSNLPKAHVVSIKTMEIFRELDIEDAIRAQSTPPRYMRYAGYYAGFAGPHADYGRTITRVGAWGRGGQDLEWSAASAVSGTNLMQSRLEPLMKARAEELAPGMVRFNHSYIEHEHHDEGVLATIEDRSTGERYQVRARYLLACDGGRVIGPELGVRMEGHLGVATSISIHFGADLSRWFHDTEALTAAILNPDIGVPCVLVPMGPTVWGAHSTDWLVHLISFAGDHKLFDDATAVKTMLESLGLPDLDLQVHVINRWPLDAVVASAFRVGPVFFLGDAAHRMPPAGGHGLNSAIQDAYNLSWKLAAVLRGDADERLLDTYEMERRPFAQHVVATAFQGWQKNRELTAAIGFSPQNGPELNWSNIRTIWADGEAGEAARRRIARALPGILPNYNSLNVGFGFTYGEGALIPDGTPAPSSPDPLSVYQPSTRPGHTLPHAWVEDIEGRTALGDLIGSGRFVLVAGESGQAWCAAALEIAAERGIIIDCFTVGSTEGDWLDLRHGWTELREHGPDGAVLVRPDRFVAWRTKGAASDPTGELRRVFDALAYGGSSAHSHAPTFSENH